MKNTMTLAPKITTANWSKVDYGQSSSHSSSPSSSDLIPSQPKILSSSSSVGRNSNRASDLSDLRKMSHSEGIYTFQMRMKMANWSRFTIFQRYFMPIASARLRIRLPIEKAVMVVWICSSRAFSSSSFSSDS